MGRNAPRTIRYPSNNRAWRAIWLSIKNLLRATIHTNIAKSTVNSRLLVFSVYVSLSMTFALALTLAAYPQIALADSRLIMVTSDHCPYCKAWELDVGAAYEKSPYAPALPLTRVEIGSKMPEGVTYQKPVVGTPTFLIIYNGQEIDRQSGYFDAEMFWWWLSEHVAK